MAAFGLRIARIKTSLIPKITFFSNHALPLADHDAEIRHDYSFWKCQDWRPDKILDQGQIWLLGGLEVEQQLISESLYLQQLEFIHRFYSQVEGVKTILYHSYHDESSSKLAKIKKMSFKVQAYEQPVELLLLKSSTSPAEIASLSPSNLENITSMFGGRIPVRCFTPPSNLDINAPLYSPTTRHYKPDPFIQLTSIDNIPQSES